MTNEPMLPAPADPAPGGDPVTVIGLGLMGQALAGAFLAAGHPTTVWNRTAAKAGSLVERGAQLAASARAAVQASPLVIVCVTDATATREILEPLADALEGRVVVNLTSGTSTDARAVAAWAAEQGTPYLHGAIMAAPPAIGTTDAVLVYSGAQPAFDVHESALRRLSPNTIHLGADPGLASLYEMAMLAVMWGVLDGFLHAAALLGTAQVAVTSFTPFMNRTIAGMADWTDAYAEQIDTGSYPGDDSTIDTHLAAMAHLLDESASLGISTELPAFVQRLAERAVAEGRGGDSYAAMIDQFRKPAR
jgi:3-hydroxyisobutyrate dehydrogenase-like beta-hydroxyacid dehydrogenase